MAHQNNFFLYFIRHYRVLFISLICIIGLISQQSYSQPLADGKSKFLGSGTSSTIWTNFNKYWNQITPGNDGKWGSVEPNQGQYNWGNLDKIYNYAIDNGLPFKEHVLVWGSQQPSWISSLDSADQRAAVEYWIQSIGERYPDMAYVDVLNEPFHNPLPSYMNALGGNGATGWDWVITAFQWARQYCAPGVKLILNEYNVLHDNTVTNNYKRLIDTLKVRNLIDGIGIQGHYFEFRSDIGASGQYVWNINTIKSNLDKLASTGLPIYITEFDIDEPIDSNQLAQYKIYFPIFWNHPAVKGMTLWGSVQGDVWNAHPNTYVAYLNGNERSALQWLRSFVVPPPVPTLVSPATSAANVPRNPKLEWHSSESATSYGVQIATDSMFTSIILDLTDIPDTLLNVFPFDSNKKFFWHVNAVNERDTSEYSTASNFTTGGLMTAVNDIATAPSTFKLSQNYPNPFNPSTQINYLIPHNSFVSLKVYNLLGQEVATLFEGMKQQGNYGATFVGNGLASGIYLYRMKANNFVETKKFVLLK